MQQEASLRKSPFIILTSLIIISGYINTQAYSQTKSKRMMTLSQEHIQARYPKNKQEFLTKLKREHPRLLISKEDISRARGYIKTDAVAKRNFEELKEKGDVYLSTKPIPYGSTRATAFIIKHKIPKNQLLRLVSYSVRRIMILSTLHLLTEEEKYFKHVTLEVENLCNYPHWKPTHFLDTAEASIGVAIAYDWLYHKWTPKQKSMMRQTLFSKALGDVRNKYKHTYNGGNNWNPACNAGMTLAALAVAGEVRGQQLTETYNAVKDGLYSVRKALLAYEPEGGYPEGPLYWYFGTGSIIIMLAALESSLGDHYNLHKIFQGFSKTTMYPIYMTGPTLRIFNYADNAPSQVSHPSLWWMSKKLNQPNALYKYKRESFISKKDVHIDSRFEGLHFFWFREDYKKNRYVSGQPR